jgi:hypothetical protein
MQEVRRKANQLLMVVPSGAVLEGLRPVVLDNDDGGVLPLSSKLNSRAASQSILGSCGPRC